MPDITSLAPISIPELMAAAAFQCSDICFIEYFVAYRTLLLVHINFVMCTVASEAALA
jgi:hypothetical protein